jgi:hypothetical protein
MSKSLMSKSNPNKGQQRAPHYFGPCSCSCTLELSGHIWMHSVPVLVVIVLAYCSNAPVARPAEIGSKPSACNALHDSWAKKTIWQLSQIVPSNTIVPRIAFKLALHGTMLHRTFRDFARYSSKWWAQTWHKLEMVQRWCMTELSKVTLHQLQTSLLWSCQPRDPKKH